MASLPLDSNSTLVLCFLFVVSCLAIIVRGFGHGRKSAQPPSPPGLPIIGNLHQFRRGRPHRTLEALARRHGPIIFIRLGSVPAVVVSSASLAEAVLRTQDNVFCSRPQQYTARGTLYGCRDIAFSAYSERWRQLRRIAVVHLLGVKRVDSFRTVREEEVARFVERVRAASGAQEINGGKRSGVNVTELIITLTYSVISRAAFGNKLGGVEPAKVRDMMKELTELLGTIAVSDVFPALGWLVDWATGLHGRVKRTAAKLDSIMERTITEHEGDPGNDDGEARDLLDDLLSIAKDGDQGFKLDRIDVKGLILDMFLAGTDTTYKTIEFTMAELVKNPREMAKVQSEVRQVATGARGVVLEEELEKMDLLHAAMKETLRLHPPVPLLVPRESIHDTQLQGYDIPAKTRVMVNTWAIGRDDESWENAEEFRPERFLGGSGTMDYNGKDPRFLPFGAGRRGCPGIAFATRLAQLALANMMYHFDWELPGGQDPESFELVEASGVSPGLKSALILAVKPF
ncbi:cytochrome P450 71A1-like [Hordeum vulgare subsp. vulgare]|uniref:cytochrome P450 71A1-like n=1 Tax=Hordeum vulgare subsp. vulgare TaxID=112509 RepID=UPI000295C8AE|nr:cytochrome P450 71A1-like [Hordeum vulgare subsp. vulgare]